MNEHLRIWMQGAIAMGYLVLTFHFIRFFGRTRYALFAFFAAGFAILAIHRTMYAAGAADLPTFSLRAAGYLVILTGMIVHGRRSVSS